MKTLSETEKRVLNNKLVNDAVFTRKARYTVREIESLNLKPEQKERAMEMFGGYIVNHQGERKY